MIISTGYTEIKDSNSLEKFGKEFGYGIRTDKNNLGLYSPETNDIMFFDFKNQLLTIHNTDPSMLDSVFCFDSDRDGFLSNGDLMVLIKGGKVYLKRSNEDVFRTKLKVYAVNHKFSKEYMAKVVGVSRPSMTYWMSGKWVPIKHLDKIVKGLTTLFPESTEKEWRDSIRISRNQKVLNSLV